MIKMADIKQTIIDKTEDEKAQFEIEMHEMALYYAEADYEAIPEEIRTPYNHEAATAFKQTRYEEHLTMLRNCRVIVDYNSIKIKTVQSRHKDISVSFQNSLPEGIYEKILADIYCRKIKNGTLGL